MNRSLLLMSLLCGLLVVSSTGCLRYAEWSNELRVKKLAHKAYRQRYEFDPGFKDARHFERGWKAGYTEVALGGDGNPPTFPPVPYRSFKYRNPEGHQIIDLWFDAYREGASAAIGEGVQHFHQLPTSRHHHYQTVPTSTPTIIRHTESVPTQISPTEVKPLEQPAAPDEPGTVPSVRSKHSEDGKDLSVPQVRMQLREAPESIGGARLASGEESDDAGVILLQLDTLE